MNEPLITFIIPTQGTRDTLSRTLQSLLNQTDPEWLAIVVGDKTPDDFILPISDSRISFLKLNEKKGCNGNYAGFVRNAGIDKVISPWIGFVDDDDSLTPDYVFIVKEQELNTNLLIFKMKGGIHHTPIPAGNSKYDLTAAGVGISFAVRKEFIDKNNIRFIASEFEDWDFLYQCMHYNKKEEGINSLSGYFSDYSSWRSDLHLKILPNCCYNVKS